MGRGEKKQAEGVHSTMKPLASPQDTPKLTSPCPAERQLSPCLHRKSNLSSKTLLGKKKFFKARRYSKNKDEMKKKMKQKVILVFLSFLY